SDATDDQIMYFFCHQSNQGFEDRGGPDASSIVMTDAPVTLGDLKLESPSSVQLRGNPLVFMNSTESLLRSAPMNDGFVPYLMAKGARAVVGAESKVPALFASVWAARFFARFLGGEP